MTLTAPAGISHLLVLNDEHFCWLVVVLLCGLNTNLATLMATTRTQAFGGCQLITLLDTSQLSRWPTTPMRLALATPAGRLWFRRRRWRWRRYGWRFGIGKE